MTEIKVSWAENADRSLAIPKYETDGSAGADVRANLPSGLVVLAPSKPVLIPTGLHFEIPQGYEVQVRPRSGLALKHGITVLNSPGTIDSDYRGEVGVILINTGNTPFEVTHRMRIAQLIVAPVIQSHFRLTENLSSTARGAGGFGSTGGI